ncbi:hypothetical protein [Actinophytocola sp.]|uniref:hypothetical protein n=1 Tax=Actinophytocola sp. TaxID=1872138 RepID=UPI002ED18CB4
MRAVWLARDARWDVTPIEGLVVQDTLQHVWVADANGTMHTSDGHHHASLDDLHMRFDLFVLSS